MNPETTYPCLVLVTLTGRAWRWTGSTMVPSKRRGYDVRAEVFSRQCARPGCQELVTAAQTLPSRAARAYQERRQRFVDRRLPDHVRPDQREAERFKPIDIEVRLEGRRGQLERAHCDEHKIRTHRRNGSTLRHAPSSVSDLQQNTSIVHKPVHDPRAAPVLEDLFPDMPEESTR